jgi:hypothetical protein
MVRSHSGRELPRPASSLSALFPRQDELTLERRNLEIIEDLSTRRPCIGGEIVFVVRKEWIR